RVEQGKRARTSNMVPKARGRAHAGRDRPIVPSTQSVFDQAGPDDPDVEVVDRWPLRPTRCELARLETRNQPLGGASHGGAARCVREHSGAEEIAGDLRVFV